jgi:acetyl-CoA C-acetyltransferase
MTFVEGVALDIGWADAGRNLTELIFETVRRALDDAGRQIGEVDSVVIAAHDLVDGRSLSSMVSAPAAGAYLKDEIRLGDDGAAAFSLAAARLEAGEARCSIVAAWGRASEGNPDAIARALFDPIVEGPFGLTELTVSGLRAQQWLARRGRNGLESERIAAAERRRSHAVANPRAFGNAGGAAAGMAASDGSGAPALAEAGKRVGAPPAISPPWPLRPDELPRWADVAVAVIISDRESAVRVAGIGHGSEPYSPGDRDLAGLPGLALAVRRAIPPGVTPADLDIAELDGLTLFDEALAAEAAGLAAPRGGLRALADDGRLNRSGGAAAGYCAPAMGLTRIAEATLRLQDPERFTYRNGRYSARTPSAEGDAGGTNPASLRWALATGSSTVAAQTHTAVVLEAR